ncbi:MAG: HIT family protein [Paramuribaculum sp.]|nr:HIT family protein [Paramuribaculum sp.]
MASIFTKIVNGEIPCYNVAEDDRHFAFLDINPVQPGHTLVIPKKEEDYIFDMDDKEYADLHLFAKRVAKAIRKATGCARVSEAVIGMEVPHIHIHLVPINTESDLNFTVKKKLTDEEMKSVAASIAEAFN